MKNINNRIGIYLIGVLFIFALGETLFAQGGASGASGVIKWMRIGSLQSYFSEQGSESETGSSYSEYHVTFSWPGEYGLGQATMRAKGMWLGCVDYTHRDANGQETTYDYYTVNTGPKPNEYTSSPRPIYDAHEFRLVGKFDAPLVYVDDNLSSSISLYDELDSLDTNLGPDRMMIIKTHTAMGVTITKKIYAFGQQDHDNYFIFDYTLTNTGIIDEEGTVFPQTIDSIHFALVKRYAFAGESLSDIYPNWAGLGSIGWGDNVMNDVVGTDPTAGDFEFRAEYAYGGPHTERDIANWEDDWGVPRVDFTDPDEINTLSVMASAKFAGQVVLHADASATDTSDDLYQPSTTMIEDTESPENTMKRADFHPNAAYMTPRYRVMTAGHRNISWADDVLSQNVAVDQATGTVNHGFAAVQSFGPYTLEPGEDVHIVVATGVNGISRDKNREVSRNFMHYYLDSGVNPELVMPDGNTTDNHTEYKKAWFFTCEDSLMKTFRNAIANYESNYTLEGPPPPAEFRITSGGDRITLSWENTAQNSPGFIGYDIYRAQSEVSTPLSEYNKIFEWRSDVNSETFYEDKTPIRGNDYYYYIQSVSIVDGERMASNKMWTLSSAPANLKRPSGMTLDQVRIVPNPYDIRSRSLQFGISSAQKDRIAFYELPPLCDLKIFTERGDLVWSKEHRDGTGDEVWNQLTSSGQLVTSGLYILYVEVTEDYTLDEDYYASYDIIDPETQEVIVPQDSLIASAGQTLYKKGQSIFRKFVIIR